MGVKHTRGIGGFVLGESGALASPFFHLQPSDHLAGELTLSSVTDV